MHVLKQEHKVCDHDCRGNQRNVLTVLQVAAILGRQSLLLPIVNLTSSAWDSLHPINTAIMIAIETSAKLAFVGQACMAVPVCHRNVAVLSS